MENYKPLYTHTHTQLNSQPYLFHDFASSIVPSFGRERSKISKSSQSRWLQEGWDNKEINTRTFKLSACLVPLLCLVHPRRFPAWEMTFTHELPSCTSSPLRLGQSLCLMLLTAVRNCDTTMTFVFRDVMQSARGVYHPSLSLVSLSLLCLKFCTFTSVPVGYFCPNENPLTSFPLPALIKRETGVASSQESSVLPFFFLSLSWCTTESWRDLIVSEALLPFCLLFFCFVISKLKCVGLGGVTDSYHIFMTVHSLGIFW